MPKYKCPKCGTIYTEVPRFCSTCGVEFVPPEVMLQTVPAKKEEPVTPVAPQETVKQPEPQIKQPEPIVEEKPMEDEGVPFNLEDAQEGNNNKVQGRTIVGFIFAILLLFPFAFAVLDIFMYGLTDIDLRLYIGVSASFASFVFAIVALACTGKLSNVKKAKGLAVFSKVIGVIFLILSIILLLAWSAAYVGVNFGEALEGLLGFNAGEYISNFLLTGSIK